MMGTGGFCAGAPVAMMTIAIAARTMHFGEYSMDIRILPSGELRGDFIIAGRDFLVGVYLIRVVRIEIQIL
jgi:hypothetical protein